MTAAGGVMDIFGGIQANQAYSAEAGALKAQSNEAIKQAELEAASKADQVRQYAANQQEDYSSSGVTLAGTPAQVIADTHRKGQQEVDAIARRGAFQAQLLRTQANQVKSAGRNAILGGLFKAGTSVASYFL
jgi:3-deoxy-D-arabino-heptulosonate 7-phosphate (DAHP) synthase